MGLRPREVYIRLQSKTIILPGLASETSGTKWEVHILLKGHGIAGHANSISAVGSDGSFGFTPVSALELP